LYTWTDCEKCDARIATINNDDILREKELENVEKISKSKKGNRE
jgi:hypothetical protein